MEAATLVALAGATAVLAVIPGPNMAFFVANTLDRGRAAGLVAILGTALGLACQLALVVSGLAALIQFVAGALVWLKWAGVAYLLVLGVLSWRKGRAGALHAAPSRVPLARLVPQGMALALLNPKTLLFLLAFLPQFLPPGAGTGAILSVAAVYLGTLVVIETGLVLGAGALRGVLGRMVRLRHRLTGALFLLSGLGLALARGGR